MKKVPTRLVDMMKGLHKEVWKDVIAEEYIDKERESWGVKPRINEKVSEIKILLHA